MNANGLCWLDDVFLFIIGKQFYHIFCFGVLLDMGDTPVYGVPIVVYSGLYISL